MRCEKFDTKIFIKFLSPFMLPTCSRNSSALRSFDGLGAAPVALSEVQVRVGSGRNMWRPLLLHSARTTRRTGQKRESPFGALMCASRM